MASPVESFKALPPWGKGAVVLGGGAVAFYVYRSHAASSAAAAAAAASGLSTPDTATGAGTGNGLPVTGVGTVGGTAGTTSGYGTPDQWASAAQAGLALIGFDPVTVGTALGAYLNGSALTAGQAAIVNTARAEFDTQGLALPSVVLASSTGPAVSGNTTPKITAGHVISVSTHGAVVGWTGENAVSYHLRITGPGAINGHTGTTTVTQGVYTGLQAGHNYAVYVTPYAANGQAGPTGRIDIKTPKG